MHALMHTHTQIFDFVCKIESERNEWQKGFERAIE